MYRLARSVLFAVKKPHNSRSLTNLVHQKATQIHKTTRTLTKLSFQPKFGDDSNWCRAIQKCQFSSNTPVTQLEYEKYCAETLDDLSDYIEQLIESASDLASADVVNNDGVLTVNLGPVHGIYVINKQSPNKQIWLSSPISGPKRFDFAWAADGHSPGYWIYKHSGETLHEILDKEFTEITKTKTRFQTLSYGLRC